MSPNKQPQSYKLEGFCLPKPELCSEACVSARGVALGTQRSLKALEDGGGERWAAEEIVGLGPRSRLPGAEQHRVLAGREEAAAACGLPGVMSAF